MTKRRILTAAVIFAALLLIALILFLTSRKPRSEQFAGGEDTPWPYAWTQLSDGTLLVKPKGDIPAGYGWTVAQADAAIAAVSEQDSEGRTAFLLTPVGTGDSFFILALTGHEDEEDQLCRLIMTVEVSGEKKPKAAVTGHRLEIVEGILRGGEDLGTPYRVWTEEDGTLQLRLTDSAGAEDWKLLVRTPSTLDSLGLRREAGRVSAKLYSPAAGEMALVLYSPTRGLSLEVTGQADKEGNIRASAHEMRQHPDWIGREDGYADADVLAGVVAAPEGAEDVQYAADNLGSGIGITSRMDFRYLDFEWTLYLPLSGGVSERMEKQIPEETLTTVFIPAGLLVAAFEENYVIAWCDTEERSYLLEGTGEGIDRDVLIQTAAAVITTDEE